MRSQLEAKPRGGGADTHQVPLLGVAGVVKGQGSLGAAQNLLLRVPQDVRVCCQDVSGTAGPHRDSVSTSGAQQVVSLKLADLAPALQTRLLRYLGRTEPGGYDCGKCGDRK